MCQILVVDDDDLIREPLALLLKINGYSVVEAASGQQALAALENEGFLPSVVLLDVAMPRVDGDELLSVLRARGILQRLRVVVFSAYHELPRAALRGTFGFIQKTVALETLLKKLRAIESGATTRVRYDQAD